MAFSVPFHIDAELGYVTCFSQWNISKHIVEDWKMLAH